MIRLVESFGNFSKHLNEKAIVTTEDPQDTFDSKYQELVENWVSNCIRVGDKVEEIYRVHEYGNIPDFIINEDKSISFQGNHKSFYISEFTQDYLRGVSYVGGQPVIESMGNDVEILYMYDEDIDVQKLPLDSIKCLELCYEMNIREFVKKRIWHFKSLETLRCGTIPNTYNFDDSKEVYSKIYDLPNLKELIIGTTVYDWEFEEKNVLDTGYKKYNYLFTYFKCIGVKGKRKGGNSNETHFQKYPEGISSVKVEELDKRIEEVQKKIAEERRPKIKNLFGLIKPKR